MSHYVLIIFTAIGSQEIGWWLMSTFQNDAFIKKKTSEISIGLRHFEKCHATLVKASELRGFIMLKKEMILITTMPMQAMWQSRMM